MKSSIHFGGINQNRMAHIVNVLGFTIGSLPLLALKPLFLKGRPKVSYFQPIAGRVQLVKSVSTVCFFTQHPYTLCMFL